MGEVGTDPCLVHLHGHYDDPTSLVMTDADLAKPGAIKWTDPMLKAALVAQDPIFVGFAAEPEYVIRSLTKMRSAMQRAPASVIALEDPHRLLREVHRPSGGAEARRGRGSLRRGRRT